MLINSQFTPKFNNNITPNISNTNFRNKSYLNPGLISNIPSAQIASAKTARGAEYLLRIIMNKISFAFLTKPVKKFIRGLAETKLEQTPSFLEKFIQAGILYGSSKIVNVNIEDKIIEQLVQKDKSILFIMNHSNQKEDPKMLAYLNVLLYRAYKQAGKIDFPLPKIILNEDILKTMNPTLREAYINMGAVGIDASIIGGDKSVNIRAFLPIIKDFISNKCNIFIFPEGRLAVRKDLDLFERFQDGVANLIDKIVEKKKEVTVVPVAFSYGDKSKAKECQQIGEIGRNSMNIGTPIEIRRKDDITTITSGDILKRTESCLFDFFNKHKDLVDIPITSEGKPVKREEISEFLKTILCENLEIGEDLAKKQLEVPLQNESIMIK